MNHDERNQPSTFSEEVRERDDHEDLSYRNITSTGAEDAPPACSKEFMEMEITSFDEDAIDISPPWYILPTIVVSQFAGTSVWFATNAILPHLDKSEFEISLITSAIQVGFIMGSLAVALTNVADYMPPTLLFGLSSLVASACNALLMIRSDHLAFVLIVRWVTGLCLAGIYPIGMKIASDWYGKPGRALGYLVGALVLGTSFPFCLDAFIPDQPWTYVLWETSGFAAFGGLCMLFIVPPNGPHRTVGTKLGDPMVIVRLFRENQAFRGAAFGYFGHMWELYAFWTWCPMLWMAYLDREEVTVDWSYNMVAFAIIVSGAVGCVVGGHLSEYVGSAKIAFGSLALSGFFCLISPFLYVATSHSAVLALYLLWGFVVVADSPQFSSLVAQTAPPETKGTALTIVNSIGFTLTVLSIQLLGVPMGKRYCFLLLAPGPLFGVWHMRRHVFGTFGLDASNAVVYSERRPEDVDTTTPC